jgi:single-strand DNA-binding protein
VLWRGLAELAQKYLHKSSLVYIEGRLKTRHWEDRDHNKRAATEIVADNLIMLDKRSEPGTEHEHGTHSNETDISLEGHGEKLIE